MSEKNKVQFEITGYVTDGKKQLTGIQSFPLDEALSLQVAGYGKIVNDIHNATNENADNTYPKNNWRKEEIQAWLKQNNIDFDSADTKDVLLDKVDEFLTNDGSN